MGRFDDALDMAKAQVTLRALRYGHFPADIFAEYAWDVMLHMYIGRLRNQSMYVDNIVNLTSKTKLIGDRWIKHLVSENIVETDGDSICLTANAFRRMDDYHARAMELIGD